MVDYNASNMKIGVEALNSKERFFTHLYHSSTDLNNQQVRGGQQTL